MVFNGQLFKTSPYSPFSLLFKVFYYLSDVFSKILFITNNF